jgi:integrase
VAGRASSRRSPIAFLKSAPKHLHLPLLLALWTGQRQGDILKLTWDQYDGRYIRLQQGKSRKRVVIPCGEPLRAALDAEPRRAAMVLLTSFGTPWSEDGFRSSWAKACDKAGIRTELRYHDMRGSAVTRLALAGCSVPEIATFTGHSLKDVQEILDQHYLSRDVGLADSALAKLEAANRPANRLGAKEVRAG